MAARKIVKRLRDPLAQGISSAVVNSRRGDIKENCCHSRPFVTFRHPPRSTREDGKDFTYAAASSPRGPESNGPMNELIKPEDLIAQNDATQLNFLRTELQICRTLAEVSTTEQEMDDHSGLSQARANAEAGYETITRFVANLRDPAHREEIQLGLRELRAVLDRLDRGDLP